ncbi:hypothetical protein CHS0354_022484 [Potamilus streckersoni]|uniref:GATA-type domain-containing protein n=1 Tax=Potamilus streckersoni TaxID=2493646 RepID=A0AAE0SXA4_9BIVA|nr:hypothetical protein CHS0354_022484 [Potamilus streckersoni]
MDRLEKSSSYRDKRQAYNGSPIRKDGSEKEYDEAEPVPIQTPKYSIQYGRATRKEGASLNHQVYSLRDVPADDCSGLSVSSEGTDVASDPPNPCNLRSSRRSRRKSLMPQKSPSKTDPRFRGVTVWLLTEFKGDCSKLLMSACYSNVRTSYHGLVTPHQRHNSAASSPERSGSDTEDVIPFSRDTFVLAKICASCSTKRTPLWRDAEDGTPLCNACGIRYKKYRLRCGRCWHIPKKDIKTYPNCPCCGAALRFSFSRRSW